MSNHTTTAYTITQLGLIVELENKSSKSDFVTMSH